MQAAMHAFRTKRSLYRSVEFGVQSLVCSASWPECPVPANDAGDRPQAVEVVCPCTPIPEFLFKLFRTPLSRYQFVPFYRLAWSGYDTIQKRSGTSTMCILTLKLRNTLRTTVGNTDYVHHVRNTSSRADDWLMHKST